MSSETPGPAAMARLHAQCFTTPRPWSEQEFAGLCEARGVFVEGDATAFVLGRVVADEVELLTLAVSPNHRREGKGRALLAAFERQARTRGASSAFLEVAADNAPAITLYSGAGWCETGRRRGYYAAPDGARLDALVMARTLG